MSSRPFDLSADELRRQDRWLRALVRNLVGESDVDDVVQDTWVSALGRARPVERPPAWLSVVAVNFARRARRSVRRRSQREEVAARPEVVPSTEETLELLDLQQHVVRAVRELSEPYRTTVLLRYTHGLAVPAIAARTGVDAACVRQRLKRGLDALRADVGVRCADDWRQRPALAAWLVPGVVEMKKTTSVAAAVLVVASLGGLALWVDRPVESAGASGDEPVELAVAEDTEAEPTPAPEAAWPEADTRAPVVSPDTPPPEPVAEGAYAGHVFDARGGPLGDVGVGLTPDARGKIPAEGLVRPAVATTSAQDGAFRVSTDLEWAELVPGPGWVPLADRTYLHEDVILVVAPAVEMGGVVTDPAGAPLDGVAVSVVGVDLKDFGGVLQSVRRAEWLESATDETGRFLRRDLPAERGRLRFEKEGYLARELDVAAFDATDLAVVLDVDEVAYVVTGWVLAPNGGPVEGALVGLGDRTTRSGDGGAFALRIPGEHAPAFHEPLWAASPPWRTEVVERFGTRLLEDADRALEVELVFEGETLAIAGRIVDAEGAPVDGVSVYIWRQRELMRGRSAEELAVPEDREVLRIGPGLRVWSRTDAEGRFRLDGLLDTEYRLRLIDLERFAATTTEPIRAGDDDVLITLPADFVRAEVTGRVVDRSGAGMPGLTITPHLGTYLTTTSLRSRDDGRETRYRTDDGGRFTLVNVSGSDLMLSLHGESIMPARHYLRDGDPVTDVEIVVDRRCHFRLVLTGERAKASGMRVLDAAGAPLDVAALGGGEYTWSEWRAIEGGRTRVLSVAQSAATLVLYDATHAEVDRLPLALRAGEVNEIDW